MRKSIYILAGGLLIALSYWSFVRSSLTVKQYVVWMGEEENGHVTKFKSGSYVMELQHRNPELMAIHGAPNAISTEDQLNKEKSKYEELIYFTLKMKNAKTSEFLYSDVTNDAEYHAMNEYFSYAMSDDLFLISGADTIQPCLYHFEHNYGSAPYNTAIFAFEKIEIHDELKVVYNDKILGLGIVEFQMDGDKIRYSPSIKF